MLSSKGDFI